MRNYSERLYSALDNQLSEVTINGESLTEQYRASILLCKKAMSKLKSYISSYSFVDTAEEVLFFKEMKPQFYSKYIYFVWVYKFLNQKPPGGDDAIKAYINFHLAGLQRFFDNNKAFYQYYRTGATQMDEVYYTRGSFDVQMELEDFEEDELYSTSHDYKLSKIIANEKYQDYLNLEMLKLTSEGAVVNAFPFALATWTAGKTDAVELIYSLIASGAVNNGNIDISELVTIWEYIFQVDLKDYYHKYTDITRRKKEVTIFLDRMKTSFLRGINDKLG